jgi:hypothetical protein
MSSQSSRPGGYRICSSCGARHKPHVMLCATCGASLASTSVWHAGPATLRTTAPTMQARVIRALVAGGVLAAIGAGFWVRSVFRGAALEQTARSEVRADVRADVPPAEPNWTPPALAYPQLGGSNLAYPGPLPLPVDPSTVVMPTAVQMPVMAQMPAPMQMTAPVQADVPASGMVAIAPQNPGPVGKTSFTDSDLARSRAGGAATPPAAIPAASIPAGPAAVPTAAAAAPVPSVSDETLRAWRERIRDRQDAVQEAKARVRRLAAESEAARVQVTVAGADTEALAKARRELEGVLDDLVRAERAASSAERDLEEEKERAAREGLTVR